MLLKILVHCLVLGLGVAQGIPLAAQAGRTGWPRTDGTVFYPVNDSIRTLVDAVGGEDRENYLQFDYKGLVCTAVGPSQGIQGRKSDRNVGKQPSGAWVAAVEQVASRSTVLFTELFADWCSRVREGAGDLDATWDQLHCARTAAKALEAERRFKEYWDYYAAWDRWLPGRRPVDSASSRESSRFAGGELSPLDQACSMGMLQPPLAIRRAVVGSGCVVSQSMDRLAGELLNVPDRIESWSQTRRAGGQRSAADGLAAGLMSGCGRGIGLAGNYLAATSVWLAEQVNTVTAGTIEFLARVPVEAIGQVWPD